MTTANVVVTRSGTGWTVDVTACNLLSDVNIKDFIVLHNNILVGNSTYTKTTPTTLTYVGSSLPSNTTVEIRRKTPNDIIQLVTYGQKFSSSLWNNELDRIIRWREEVDLNGAGNVAATPTPQNDPFGVVWQNDTFYSATRKALYDYLITLAVLASPQFSGSPTSTTPPTNDDSTRIATTEYVKNNLDSYVLSSTLTTLLNSYATDAEVSTLLSNYVLNSSISDTNWVSPTLLNNFTNFGAPFSTASYRRKFNGTVFLRGVIQNNVSVPAFGTVILNLPVGFRPASDVVFIAQCGTNSLGISSCRIDVISNGEVRFQGLNHNSPGTTIQYISLNGITFETT